MSVESLPPSTAAACVLTLLTRAGATFTVTAAGHLHTNLDAVPYPVPGFEQCSRDAIARLILGLADEIKQLVRADQVRH